MAARLRALGFLLIAVLATLPRPTAAQSDPASESERKALFVYNFMLFVDWPADAFQNASEALRVEIIGRDPFNGSLDRLLADKSVGGRRIVVTHSVAPKAGPLPHVLFVSAAEAPNLARVLAAYCHLPVLTVSDLEGFANRGGVIGLVEENHDLHFVINRTAAGEARLQVSSRLFYLAVPLFSAIGPCEIPARPR
ncbi:MAG TPA: YfiR family protein [Vicinamibacterales bacterium]|nr:YfiR family protein [Vicinamibacterales bacterium]